MQPPPCSHNRSCRRRRRRQPPRCAARLCFGGRGPARPAPPSPPRQRCRHPCHHPPRPHRSNQVSRRQRPPCQPNASASAPNGPPRCASFPPNRRLRKRRPQPRLKPPNTGPQDVCGAAHSVLAIVSTTRPRMQTCKHAHKPPRALSVLSPPPRALQIRLINMHTFSLFAPRTHAHYCKHTFHPPTSRTPHFHFPWL